MLGRNLMSLNVRLRGILQVFIVNLFHNLFLVDLKDIRIIFNNFCGVLIVIENCWLIMSR